MYKVSRRSKAEWLKLIKQNYPFGMAVNVKYMPQLSEEKTLKQLIREKKLRTERAYRGSLKCRWTLVLLNEG